MWECSEQQAQRKNALRVLWSVDRAYGFDFSRWEDLIESAWVFVEGCGEEVIAPPSRRSSGAASSRGVPSIKVLLHLAYEAEPSLLQDGSSAKVHSRYAYACGCLFAWACVLFPLECAKCLALVTIAYSKHDKSWKEWPTHVRA